MSGSTQIATVAIYQFAKHKYWAFKQMQLGYRSLSNVPGLQFHKILGTGAGNGFSIYPNLGQYAMLCVWDDETSAAQFFDEDPYQKEYSSNAANRETYYLRPVHGHGLWDKGEPFEFQQPLEQEGAWAVITRATISKRRLLEFWKHVPSVSKSIENRPGLSLSVGIGEWPLIQQATFSVWDSLDYMKDYAYKSRLHKEVVTKTRDRNWYSEELFARFQVLRKV
ncbi:MAG: spheroidene monooxygenase [Bacteroidota bacterium]